ncbi:hypothetical protein R0135_03370 [Congregibacter variabilis]|uniref:Uncharacterized protein n=1 Tax=Congregibacter variabilis TaxID=3081200 RepID=A0ABZ0I6W0_9GAMM|nr:hypothetical protein R0135_03370 [Congregibacter sp. IMCC43200]
MTRKSNRQKSSGWAKALPQRALKRLDSLGADELAKAQAANSYAVFLANKSYRETTAPPKAVTTHIAETEKAISELRRCLDGTPDQIASWASYQLNKSGGTTYRAYCRSVMGQLEHLRDLQRDAERNFASQEIADAGERPKNAEARLLSELSSVIEPLVHTKLRAAEVAGELAVLLGISGLPSSDKGLADRIRNYRKSVEIDA